jgi:hypothetical protein
MPRCREVKADMAARVGRNKSRLFVVENKTSCLETRLDLFGDKTTCSETRLELFGVGASVACEAHVLSKPCDPRGLSDCYDDPLWLWSENAPLLSQEHVG